jgi:hypothetical protein
MQRSKKSDRIRACELAAQVMAGRPEDNPAPLLWCLTVFFESYIEHGCKGTQKEFGPKKLVQLKVVK